MSSQVTELWEPYKGSVFIFTVFFSEICKWDVSEIDFREEIYIYVWKKSAVLGKILHQMISEHRIMAYDPYNKPDSVRLISLPGVSIESDGRGILDIFESLLDEHQGHLRYFVADLDERLDEFSGSLSVWVLDDYERGKQHDGGRISRFPVPLSYHPCNANLAFLINTEALFSYDFNTRKLKIGDDSMKNLGCPCRTYFLFVIPPWPVLSINPSPLRSLKID